MFHNVVGGREKTKACQRCEETFANIFFFFLYSRNFLCENIFMNYKKQFYAIIEKCFCNY